MSREEASIESADAEWLGALLERHGLTGKGDIHIQSTDYGLLDRALSVTRAGSVTSHAGSHDRLVWDWHVGQKEDKVRVLAAAFPHVPRPRQVLFAQWFHAWGYISLTELLEISAETGT